jgi:hypothetical protein
MSESIKKERKSHIFARDELDFYVEPISATRQLLAVETFDGFVHDPSCGSGNIIKAFQEIDHHLHPTTGSDITNRVGKEWWFHGEIDFLSDDCKRPLTNIAMNPPYYRAKGTEAFIRKALTLASRKVAAFVDIRFLTGAGRANGLFAEYPPARIWIVTPRVSCPPGSYLEAGNKAQGGTQDFCWMIWDISSSICSETKFGWLR